MKIEYRSDYFDDPFAKTSFERYAKKIFRGGRTGFCHLIKVSDTNVSKNRESKLSHSKNTFPIIHSTVW
jgi:hypothetical protein